MAEDSCKPKGIRKIQVRGGQVNYVCLREACPSTCCGPFGGVHGGIESLEGHEFSEIFLTEEDSRLLISKGCAPLIELIEQGKYRMKLLPDGSCIALKDGRCSIHDIKPTLCRAFPFYIDMFVGLCGVTSCPGFGAGWTDIRKVMDDIKAARTMYDHWLSYILDLSRHIKDVHE